MSCSKCVLFLPLFCTAVLTDLNISQTSTSRFRGKKREYQLAFLATHFVVEAHREALLHSFIVARSDRNLDGILSLDERRTMLLELGYNVGEGESVERLEVPFPRRQTRARLPDLLRRAGIDEPGATAVAFSSMDGFGMGTIPGTSPKKHLRPVLHVDESDTSTDEQEADKAALDRGACSMQLERCFGGDFLSPKKSLAAVDVFRQLASVEPTCGDCVVVALVGKSGPSGLSAFLPDCSSSSSSSSSPSLSSSTSTFNDEIPPPSLFTLSKSAWGDSLPLSLPRSSSSSSLSPSTCSSARAFSIRRILRYTHTLGDSTSRFVGMQNDRTMKMHFQKMRERKERGEMAPTFLTLSTSFPFLLMPAYD
jgi:hypothetical protein